MRSIRTAATSLVLAVGLSVASAGLAGAATAAPTPSAPLPVKGYPTWPAAQKAAGFQLVRPTKTDGLRRRRGILVAACPRPRAVVGKRNRQVMAMYGAIRRPAGSMITFGQDKSARGRCLGLFGRPGGKIIAGVRVAGVTAILRRAHARLCIRRGSGKPTCHSVVILRLTWTKHGHFYGITGLGERRASIIGFARHLVAVR